MILKRELGKEKTDEMKYSHFLCTLERSYQDKLKMAIIQLKCVPCLNKFTATSFSLLHQSSSASSLQSSPQQQSKGVSQMTPPMISNGNMNRLLKQMSLIVSTELQHIAIDLIERYDDELNSDKPVKYIKLKEEFRYQPPALNFMQHMQNTQNNTVGQSNNNFSSIRNEIKANIQANVHINSGSTNNNVGSIKPIGSNPRPVGQVKNIFNYLDVLGQDVKAPMDQTAKSTFIDHSRNQFSTNVRY
jgi:hypothetical protein